MVTTAVGDPSSSLSTLDSLEDREWNERSVVLVDPDGLRAMGSEAESQGYLWVEVEPPRPMHRGRLALHIEECIEDRLVARGAPPPGVGASTGLDASLSDQLYRARLLEMRGIAVGIPGLEGITNLGGTLDAEDSAVLRWWIATSADRPVRLVLSGANRALRVYPSPVPFSTLLEGVLESPTPRPASIEMAASVAAMELSDLPPVVAERSDDEETDETFESVASAETEAFAEDVSPGRGASAESVDAGGPIVLEGDAPSAVENASLESDVPAADAVPESAEESSPADSGGPGVEAASQPVVESSSEDTRESVSAGASEDDGADDLGLMSMLREASDTVDDADDLHSDTQGVERGWDEELDMPDLDRALGLSPRPVDEGHAASAPADQTTDSASAEPGSGTSMNSDLGDAAAFVAALEEEEVSSAAAVNQNEIPTLIPTAESEMAGSTAGEDEEESFAAVEISPPPVAVAAEEIEPGHVDEVPGHSAAVPASRVPSAGRMNQLPRRSEERAGLQNKANGRKQLPPTRDDLNSDVGTPSSESAGNDMDDPFTILARREWRAWAKELSAATGPKPLAVVERMFVTAYTRLCEAVRRGVADDSAQEVLDAWRESFAQSYSEAFDALRVRGKRPTMVLDVPSLAQRIGRLHGARRVQLLLVDAMRFDVGLMVQDRLKARADASLTERLLLWSALPTNTTNQLELIGKGPEGLKDRSSGAEAPAVVARGQAARTPRRIRTGRRELFKLDVVEAALRETEGGVTERLAKIADETSAALAEHFAKQAPRTLVMVFGDHGFQIDEGARGTTAQVTQGGSTPEEVLVPAFAWLTGSVH